MNHLWFLTVLLFLSQWDFKTVILTKNWYPAVSVIIIPHKTEDAFFAHGVENASFHTLLRDQIMWCNMEVPKVLTSWVVELNKSDLIFLYGASSGVKNNGTLEFQVRTKTNLLVFTLSDHYH